MITKTINLYEFSELDEKAKQKAIDYLADDSISNYQDLQISLDIELDNMLTEHNIKRAGDKFPQIYYSLSHSQGDGCMFEGEFTFKDITLYIKHSGRYYHEHSKIIEAQETKNLGYHIDEEEPLNKQVEEFEVLYIDICKKLAKFGYARLDEMRSEEYIQELCNANEYYFTKDGLLTDKE